MPGPSQRGPDSPAAAASLVYLWRRAPQYGILRDKQVLSLALGQEQNVACYHAARISVEDEKEKFLNCALGGGGAWGLIQRWWRCARKDLPPQRELFIARVWPLDFPFLLLIIKRGRAMRFWVTACVQ